MKAAEQHAGAPLDPQCPDGGLLARADGQPSPPGRHRQRLGTGGQTELQLLPCRVTGSCLVGSLPQPEPRKLPLASSAPAGPSPPYLPPLWWPCRVVKAVEREGPPGGCPPSTETSHWTACGVRGRAQGHPRPRARPPALPRPSGGPVPAPPGWAGRRDGPCMAQLLVIPAAWHSEARKSRGLVGVTAAPLARHQGIPPPSRACRPGATGTPH